MARLALINKEQKRVRLSSKNNKRRDLKERIRLLLKEPYENAEQIQELFHKLQKMPRDTSPTRVRNRCQITGRSRGVYSKVKLSRSMFRLHAMKGNIPGIVKSSW